MIPLPQAGNAKDISKDNKMATKYSEEFKTWLNTFVEEKGLDLSHTFEVEGKEWGTNFIPLENVIECILLNVSDEEKYKLKNQIVKIDFANGDVMHLFEYIAKFMAI